MVSYQVFKKLIQYVVPFKIYKYISVDKSGSVYYSVNPPTVNEQYQTWQFEDEYMIAINASEEYPDVDDWKESIQQITDNKLYAEHIDLKNGMNVIFINGQVGTIIETGYMSGGAEYIKIETDEGYYMQNGYHDRDAKYFNHKYLLYGTKNYKQYYKGYPYVVIGVYNGN